jgi:aspartyl-tRNA(Asn)/glutamyl-tRNA(Gln) amidotransferase subunit C
MISKEEVQHIAKLARLELTGKEIEKMQKDLSAILDYFDLLKKAPKAEKNDVKNTGLRATRKDEVVSSYGIADELIAEAPDKKDGYIKVKAIF